AAHLTLFLFAAIALGERGSLVFASDLMARQSPSVSLQTSEDPCNNYTSPATEHLGDILR
ncbi:hypothetical protein PHLCEN_2v2327, partial [Hermanssonia centrifuga]